MSRNGYPICPECTGEMKLAGNKIVCSACNFEQPLQKSDLASSHLTLIRGTGCPDCRGPLETQGRIRICGRCGYSPTFVA